MLDFEINVIERSFSVPVVVDFWAPWCGPCTYLGPVIEDLAARANGRWELVKINADENQELMRQYRVQGIPAVKMFSQGVVVAEFTGALPRPEIEKWLEKNIPDQDKLDYEELLKTMNWPATEAQLTKLAHFIADHAGFADAVIDLAAQQVLTDPEASLQAMKNITFGHPRYDTVTAIRTLAELLAASPSEDEKVDDLLKEAQKSLRKKEPAAALEALIKLLTINKSFQQELPRRSVIAIFHLAGTQSQLTRNYQRRFSMALY